MRTLNEPTYSNRHARRSILRLIAFSVLLFLQTSVYAFQIESVAMRNMDAFNKFESLEQNAVVIKIRDTGFRYMNRFELASGEISNDDVHSFFISAGPSWRFKKRIARSGLAFVEFGTSPTWISNDEFEDRSLGGNIFFTSNIQIGAHFGYRREVTISLRVHHISNGGMNAKNPGTDMIGLEFSHVLGR